MGLGAALNCRCEVVLHQCLTHHRNVVVEVPTNDDMGMWVLPGDVFGDIDDPFGMVLQLLLFSWLDVAVEDLYSVGTDLQLCPAQVGTHGLHQRQLRIGERRCPAATMSLCIGLERPVAVEEEWALKFCLIETYELWSVLGEDLVHLLLFLCGVDASHIVVHDGELVAVLRHFLRSLIRSSSLPLVTTDCISSSLCAVVGACVVVAATSTSSTVRSMLLHWGIPFAVAVAGAVATVVLLFFSCTADVILRSCHSAVFFALLSSDILRDVNHVLLSISTSITSLLCSGGLAAIDTSGIFGEDHLFLLFFVAEAMLLAAIAIFGTFDTVSSEAGKYWQICRGHLLFFGVGHGFDPRRCWWGPLAALVKAVFDSSGQRPFFGALGYILFWQLNMIAQSNIFLRLLLLGVFSFLKFLDIINSVLVLYIF